MSLPFFLSSTPDVSDFHLTGLQLKQPLFQHILIYYYIIPSVYTRDASQVSFMYSIDQLQQCVIYSVVSCSVNTLTPPAIILSYFEVNLREPIISGVNV